MYGWSVEAMGHSLNDSQVKSIQDLMESNDYGELWEAFKAREVFSRLIPNFLAFLNL